MEEGNRSHRNNNYYYNSYNSSLSHHPSTFLRRAFRYWSLARHYWWLILGCVTLGIIWSIYFDKKDPPIYLSVGRMMVSPRITLPDGVAYSEELSHFLGTQVEIMQSSEILEKARQKVKESHPELDAKATFVARQVPMTSIFALEARSLDPTYAHLFLNAVMHEFTAFKREQRQQTSLETISNLTAQLSRLRREQEEQQKAIIEFKKKYNIAYWEAQGTAAAAYLSELKNKEAELQTQLKFLKTFDIQRLVDQDGITAIANANTLLKNLPVNESLSDEYFSTQKDLYKAEVELQEFLKYLQPEHPKIKRIKERIEQLKTFLALLLKQNLNVATANVDTIQKELKIIEETIKEWEDKALHSSKIEAEYELLQVTLEQTKSFYSNLLRNIQGLEINENISQETIQILAQASPAMLAPKSWFSGIVRGIFIGLSLGIILLILIDVMDDRVTSSFEVLNLPEPILSEIPSVPTSKNNPASATLEPKESRLFYAEAYRHLRSSLIFREDYKPLKTIMISSALPEEGKTTVAMNLAITFANTGYRILLIDGDLRRANLSDKLGQKDALGVTDILEGKATVESCIHNTQFKNLSFLPRGTDVEQPGEIFLKPELDAFLENIQNNFDRIIFDSAPILSVTDSSCLAPKVDGTIVVLRTQHTSLDKVRHALNTLHAHQSYIAGLVVNGVEKFPAYYGGYIEYYA